MIDLLWFDDVQPGEPTGDGQGEQAEQSQYLDEVFEGFEVRQCLRVMGVLLEG